MKYEIKYIDGRTECVETERPYNEDLYIGNSSFAQFYKLTENDCFLVKAVSSMVVAEINLINED